MLFLSFNDMNEIVCCVHDRIDNEMFCSDFILLSRCLFEIRMRVNLNHRFS